MLLLECLINIYLLFIFSSSSLVSHWLLFPSIETMDGVLRLLLFFGIFNAKLIKIAL